MKIRAWRVAGSAMAAGMVLMTAMGGATSASAATFGGAQDAVVAYSDQGDWVGGGQQRIWRGDDATIGVSGDAGGVSASVDGGPSGDYFDFAIASAPGTPLGVGVYTDAQRTPFRTSGHPGLDVYGSGRGCNTDSGNFEIRDIGRDASGAVTRLWAVYELHCEGGVPAMWGEIRVGEPGSGGATLLPSVVRWPTLDAGASGSTVPVTLRAGDRDVQVAGLAIGGDQPGDFRVRDDTCSGRTIKAGRSCSVWVRFVPGAPGLRQADVTLVDTTGKRYDTPLQGWAHGGTTAFRMTGDAGDWITGGRTLDYTPANARFSVRGTRNALSASITGDDGSWWYVDASPAAGDIIAAGTTYAPAHRNAFRGTGPGLEVTGNGAGCNEITGTFTVDEARWYESGALLGTSFSFEQHCESGSTAARGTFAWRAGDTAVPAPWAAASPTPTTLPDPPATVTLPVTAPPVDPAPPTDPTPPADPTSPADPAPTTTGTSTPAATEAGTSTPASPAPRPVTKPGSTVDGGSVADTTDDLRTASVGAAEAPLLTYRGVTKRGRVLSFSARMPRAGTLVITPTIRVRGTNGKAQTVTLGRGRVTAERAGRQPVTVRLSARALGVLAKHPSAPLTTRMTWKPKGADPVTSKASDVLRTR